MEATRREQPLDLAHAPTLYPGHDYTGDGEIVAVYAGDDLVGHLTRKGDAVGWLPAGDLPDAADTVRILVQDTLLDGARSGVPLIDTWALVLDSTQHDQPTTGSLSKLIS